MTMPHTCPECKSPAKSMTVYYQPFDYDRKVEFGCGRYILRHINVVADEEGHRKPSPPFWGQPSGGTYECLYRQLETLRRTR